jgi:hypothetical protein
VYFLGAEMAGGKKTFLKLKLLFKEVKYLHTFMEKRILLLVFYAESKTQRQLFSKFGRKTKDAIEFAKIMPTSFVVYG